MSKVRVLVGTRKGGFILTSDAPLPEAVVKGQEPFLIIGSVAGG